MSIETVAEVRPFMIFTNERGTLLYLRSIVGAAGKLIVGATFSTKIESDFSFRIIMMLSINEDRTYSFT